MAHLDIAGDELILRLGPLERLGGFVHGDARIPLTAVRRAWAVDDPWVELRGVRAPGIRWGKRLAVGTWRFGGGKDFVALHRRRPAVVVDLMGVDFARLVVTTPEAEAFADELERAKRPPRP